MSRSIRYDFIPQTVSVGRFGDSNVFVSCRYKYDKWMNVTVFERLCKFKPNDQRDPEKQLKKAICNAVSVIGNEPTSGFSIVDYDKDLYSRYYHESHDVVLRDPRGFCIAVTNDNFWHMLRCAGMNIRDGVIERKFAYGWNSGSQFMLVDAETKEFEDCKAASDKLKEKVDNRTYVTKKQLEIGKIYQGTKKFPGLHMYLGEMAIYDVKYHQQAFIDKKYEDIEEYCSKKGYDDVTAEKKHVFYRVDKKGSSGAEWKQPYPFNFKSSVCKLLEREVDDGNEDIELLPMFNDVTKPSTYENIKEYMSTCLLFNKVDMSTFVEGSKLCPYDLFDDIASSIYDSKNALEIDVYPYQKYDLYNCAYLAGDDVMQKEPWYRKNFFASTRSYKNKYVCIRPYSTANSGKAYKILDAGSISYWSSYEIDRIECNSTKELYDYLKPYVGTAKFENGQNVKDVHILLLQGKKHT